MRAPARALADVLDAVYPPQCWLCGGEADDATADGRACVEHALPAAPEGPRCGLCRAALPGLMPDGHRCAGCTRRPPGHLGLECLGDYGLAAPLREWILAWKHGGRAYLVEPLGEALAEHWRARWSESVRPDCGALLVPVPLHPVRRFERGFDQAADLARVVSGCTGVALATALRRRRYTPAQGAPGAVSRAANVSEAFAGRPNRLRDRQVWLVDDVVASGATVAACAAAARRAGAREVRVLALARALLR